MLQNTYMYVSENAETEKSEGIQMIIYITFAEICKQPFIHRLIKEWPVRIERGVYTVYIYIHTSQRKVTTSQVYLLVHIYRWMVTSWDILPEDTEERTPRLVLT